jgi:transcriptional regulator with XRE-family HTH domain
MTFAENLRRHRIAQFISQAELARRAGVHVLTITRLEAGATAPSSRTVRLLARALGLEPSDIAEPHEAAELRRVIDRARQRKELASGPSARWDDDGGAAPPQSSIPPARSGLQA